MYTKRKTFENRSLYKGQLIVNKNGEAGEFHRHGYGINLLKCGGVYEG